MDNTRLYQILYALAAVEGREGALFGNCAPLAYEAFERSLACDAFPELWFEIPLAGDPWFDLHALTARESLEPGMAFAPEACGGVPGAFEWFAAQPDSVRQLALSWDVSTGNIDHPAVQLLVCKPDLSVTCGFLSAVGRPDAAPAYRAFVEGLPEGWFACYTGVFPARPGHNLRVECVPDTHLREAYASDAGLLGEHLMRVCPKGVNDEAVARCALLAKAPFQIEFQFDVEPDGTAGSTFSASVRFAQPPGGAAWRAFEVDGPAGELMAQVEAWGLADGRWRDMAGTAFAQGVAFGGQSTRLYCYPAFLKLRWRDGKPFDAKAYLIAGAQ